MEKPSCWGCAFDWLEVWQPEDLAPITIDGESYHVCPPCLEEMDDKVAQVKRLIDGKASLFVGSPSTTLKEAPSAEVQTPK